MSLIIGTAGHVDHGKTELIKALTGIDTDRLPEEKEREMTIVLGFAFIDLPKYGRVGIIDVPGHERYLKNMITGVSGIDLALLVIAADEGIMPQTREHFEILGFAGISRMIVVLTKIDLIDEEIIEEAIMQIEDLLEGTRYADSKTIKVSSKTGEGLSELKQVLDEVICSMPAKKTSGVPILPIDRSFMLKGVGTVVTGSVVNGILRLGDKVCIYPRKLTSKIKQIQVHNELEKEIDAGHRVGVNLANIKVKEVDIGDVLSEEGGLFTTRLIDARLEPRTDVNVKHWMRVRVHILTNEILGRIRLLGDGKYCQILLEKPAVTWFRNKFIIRNYSPTYLIGSGTTLNPAPTTHRRKDDRVVQLLEFREKHNMEEIIAEEIKHKYCSQNPVEKIDNFKKTLFTPDGEFDSVLKKLIDSGTIKIISQYIIDKSTSERIKGKIIAELESFYKMSSGIKIGMPKEELRRKIKIEQGLFGSFLHELDEEVEIVKDKVRLKSWKALLSENQLRELEKVEEISRKEFCSFKEFNREIINILLEGGKIVNIKSEFFVHKDTFSARKLAIKNYIEENGEISIGDIKRILGTTRKYVVPFAEYLDEINFTKRVGDKRILCGGG
ncbi:selenocysteine-specific translation elongation factor [candidate division WOR-3 bacterium]|nr:selenocysteine-specific translation elongation factor [candidate division WOR-3 bacterium]